VAFNQPEPTSERPREIHVVLVEPEIHWNTGNAGRSCLAAGAQLHLVEPLGFSLDEREVRRAGLDYWARVRPRLWPDWRSFEAVMAEFGEPFFFSAEAKTPVWGFGYPDRVVFVFGRESTGLSPAIREAYADRLVGVPMLDSRTRSLNLSTTVGIALYEVMRQRGEVPGGDGPAAPRGKTR
jgi:tRNA (cytidine/uridine-2'-O-)-methyltransferase